MPPRKRKSQTNHPPDHTGTLNHAARNLGPKLPQWAQYPDLVHTQPAPPNWRMQLQQVVNSPSPAPGNQSPSNPTHPAPPSSIPISASAPPMQATHLQSFPPPNPAMPPPPIASRNGSVSHGTPTLSTFPLSPRASPPSQVPGTGMPSNHTPDMSSATATVNARQPVQFARPPITNVSQNYPVERTHVGGARQEPLVTTASPVNPPPSSLMYQSPYLPPVNSMHINPTPGMSPATANVNARETAQLGPMSRAYDYQFGPVEHTHDSGVRQQQPVTAASPVSPPPSASMHRINPVQNPAQQTSGIPMAQSAPTPVGPSHTIPPRLPPNPPTLQQARPQPSLFWFPIEQFYRARDDFIRARQNISLPQSEHHRTRLLNYAGEQNDCLFLSIHQFYCVCTLNPRLFAEFRRVAPALGPPIFDMLEDVLGSNKFFSLHSLKFFAEFPLPLLPTHPTYQTHVKSFVSMNAQYYRKLKGECVQRGFPPVVPELVHAGIRSVVLQIEVFKHILQNILSKQEFPQQLFPDLCQDALELLNQNQAQVHAWPFADPPSMEGIERNKECWRPRYIKLFQERVASLRRNGDAQRYSPEQMPMQQVHQPLSLQANPPLQRLQHSQVQNNQMQQNQMPHNQIPHNQWQQNQMQQNQMQQNQMQQNQMQQNQMQQNQMQQNQMQQVPVPYSQMQHNQVQQIPMQQNQVQHNQVQHNQVQHNQVKGRSRSPTYLHTQVAVQQREPHPERTSLHQAHVRSPTLRAAGLPQERLYRYVEGFIKRPARLEVADEKIEKWTMTLAQEMINHIPKATKNTSSASQGISVDLKSKEFHLRCIKWPVGKEKPPSENDWAAADTSWMQHAFFTLNDTHLQERKKPHHGKDKPIHVTEMLKAGENLLEITVLEKTKFKDYMLAVEMLGFMTRASILHNCCYKQRVPPEQVKKELMAKLSLDDDDDDDMSGDEVEILDSTLTIKIRDPIGGTGICAIPVRGKTCRHNECFDLETFLDTRGWKNNVSAYDQWRCPYCNADARPQHLIVDGFMQDVRVDLERKDKMHIREIVFHLDGTWEPKEGSQESKTPAPIISLDD